MNTVDLNRQRLQLTPYPGSGAPSSEAWLQDIYARLLHVMGIERISFEADEPTNHAVLWLDRGTTRAGVPGVLKIWDQQAEAWVKLTPESYRAYLSGVVRIRVYRTTTALSPDRPTAPREGDWWIIEDEGCSYLWVGDLETGFWLDQTAAPIKISQDEHNAALIGSDGGLYLDAATFMLATNLQAHGTDAERPADPVPGTTFVNTENPVLEVDLCVSDGTTKVWVQIV